MTVYLIHRCSYSLQLVVRGELKDNQFDVEHESSVRGDYAAGTART